jgi:hypothetical protein
MGMDAAAAGFFARPRMRRKVVRAPLRNQKEKVDTPGILRKIRAL